MFQAYFVIFTTLFKHIVAYLSSFGIFWQIQAYLESWHSQTYSYVLSHIQNRRHIQLVSRTLLMKSNLCIAEPYLGRFRHIQNPGLFRHVMFHAYSSIFTKIHICTHTCLHIEVYIQDPDIIGSNNVNPHLLFKSGSFVKSLFKSIWNIFSFRIVLQ